MGKENKNRFYEDFDRVNRELNQITNGPKKEQKAIDPKRKIFDGEHDPDPSDVFDKCAINASYWLPVIISVFINLFS